MGSPAATEVTRLLMAWQEGDERALDRLIPLVYDELRRMAQHHLRGQRPDIALQTTALVHEAFVRLVGSGGGVAWANRAHFFSFSAQLMRRVLVDIMRAHGSQKRGGRTVISSIDGRQDERDIPDVRLAAVVAVDEALNELGRIDPRKAKVVELRYFGGLTVEETSEALHVSRATVEREWQMARLWLARELRRA